ncbi:MAG: stress response translation initiation inhibitor YciH [Candidatus Aenigmarchaeota archaeon]|nr:stress response translation initiation inhibitor YciH [Candidatus Aenigmarchaeota archaeon]
MSEVCSICGLPKELCICGTIAKEEAKIKVFVEKRRFGKKVTVVEGIEDKANPKQLTKKLKTKLACGGTFKNNKIELRGDHIRKMKQLLINAGFPEEKIEVE